MAKIWRKAIENELDKKDIELLNILALERKFTKEEVDEFAKELKVSKEEVRKRIKALKDKKILIEEKVGIIDPMMIWDGYYIMLIKSSIIPPLISKDIQFPTGWRIETYLERLKRREKEMGLRIIRQAYCLQGTEWDILLIISAPSQDEFVEFFDGLVKEGWIKKGWSLIPVELGKNWIFDPIEVPPVSLFKERVGKIKIKR